MSRGYRDDTNILQTCFSDGARTVTITDFMPVGRRPGSGPHNYVDLIAPNTLYRIVTVSGGAVWMRLRYRPSLAFARDKAKLRSEDGRVICTAGPILHCSHRAANFTIDDDLAEAEIELPVGEPLVLALCRPDYKYGDPMERAAAFQDITAAFWREWIGYCRYRGPYAAAVRRSLLAIKLLIYAPSGAVAAAHHLAAGGDRRRAQLGLPLLLAARFRLHPLCAGGRRLWRRSAAVLDVSAARLFGDRT